MASKTTPSLDYYSPRSVIKPAEWAVSNFKAIEYATLPLRRLTVLTGANSSGKSSLIQSLLLLAQSSEDEIILNGPLVRLGEPTDVIRSGSTTCTILFSTRLRSTKEANWAEWSFSLELEAGHTTLEVVAFDAAVDGTHVLSATSSRVTSKAREEVNPGGRYGNTILRVREVFGRSAPARTYLSFRGLFPEALVLRSKRDHVLAALRRTYSKREMRKDAERIFQLYEELQPWWRSHQDALPADVVELYGNFFQRGSSPMRFFQEAEDGSLDRLFTLYAEAAEEEGWRAIPARYWPAAWRPGSYGRTLFALSDAFKDALKSLSIADQILRRIRDSVRYLGPLREEPQVVSPSGGRSRSLPAGTRGEYTADLLAREKNRRVEFRDWNNAEKQLRLPDAVSLWTTYLGVGENVAVEDQGKLGRGLRLRVHGVERDLTTVGVGASQLLPVIAVALSAEPGTTVCIEQPELHLHPAVQSRLADFFLFARPDVAFVIETHSEYFVTRIRRRVAEQTVEPRNVAVFFAEQEGGVTNVRCLRLSRDGDFSDWPKGFFDAHDDDARALVRAIGTPARGE